MHSTEAGRIGSENRDPQCAIYENTETKSKKYSLSLPLFWSWMIHGYGDQP